jgi:hypothetical protein
MPGLLPLVPSLAEHLLHRKLRRLILTIAFVTGHFVWQLLSQQLLHLRQVQDLESGLPSP